MQYDVIIIGGGIVGLATAYQLQKQQPALRLLVLEKESSLAKHQTGNNSGVIHSGLYYKPGSLKALNCIAGYHELVAFCEAEKIPYDLCGKIVVATKKQELDLLSTLYDRGVANGLTNLKKLNNSELLDYEPYVNGIAGIHVPQTGIVDYVLVAQRIAEILMNNGADIKLSTKVKDIVTKGTEQVLITDAQSYSCSLVINCAGLYSDKIAGLFQKKLELRIIPFRGEYFKLKPEKEYLVKNLIYPVPDPNFPFLGVHFTRMARGGVEAGPNAVLAFSKEGYRKRDINLKELAESLAWPGFQKVAAKYWKTGIGEMYRSFSKSAFTEALQILLPEIQADDLQVGGAGVRAQACHKNGALIDDFLILEEKGAINVCNAPSPAATSCFAIGNTIATLAVKRFKV